MGILRLRTLMLALAASAVFGLVVHGVSTVIECASLGPLTATETPYAG
ncbi:MAG: hypothetical protein HOP15_05195 [Planctomycetes bacterium]|nr:hypothetical protein [Planctomycetota bacterium]